MSSPGHGLQLARRIRAFLDPGLAPATTRELEEARGQARKVRQRKDKEIAELRAELAQKGSEDFDVEPGNIVWIFATGRSGTTWLSYMMEEMPDHTRWNEPLVGALLGHFYYNRASSRLDKKGKNFILGERYKQTWHEPVRSLVLGGAAARFPDLGQGKYLVIKEPGGSIGAPLLMEALPESRMILLVRDPRDVVASGMDARKEGSWASGRRKRPDDGSQVSPGKDTLTLTETLADSYLRSVGNARQAYEAHAGHKSLVRYEDLRASTFEVMKQIYSELSIPVDEEKLAEAIRKHAWENIPEEEKGEGKVRRKAKPGGWREDLTEEQIETVERITAPLIGEFYS